MASVVPRAELGENQMDTSLQQSGSVDNLGIRMKHVLVMLLSFCGDSVERTQRHLMLVNLCEQIVSWAPGYFLQEGLSETGYQIYLVAFFGRHAVNHSAHKQRLHRKRFHRNLPEEFVTAALNDRVFQNWTRSPYMTQKTTGAAPVQAAVHKFLVETIDIWLAGSFMDLSLSFNTELDGIQRYLYSVPQSEWPTFIVSKKPKKQKQQLAQQQQQQQQQLSTEGQITQIQKSVDEIKFMLSKGSGIGTTSFAGSKPGFDRNIPTSYPGGDLEQGRLDRGLPEQRGI